MPSTMTAYCLASATLSAMDLTMVLDISCRISFCACELVRAVFLSSHRCIAGLSLQCNSNSCLKLSQGQHPVADFDFVTLSAVSFCWAMHTRNNNGIKIVDINHSFTSLKMVLNCRRHNSCTMHSVAAMIPLTATPSDCKDLFNCSSRDNISTATLRPSALAYPRFKF